MGKYIMTESSGELRKVGEPYTETVVLCEGSPIESLFGQEQKIIARKTITRIWSQEDQDELEMLEEAYKDSETMA